MRWFLHSFHLCFGVVTLTKITLKMVQIAGSYKLDKDENLLEYVKSLGLPQEVKPRAEKPGLTVQVTLDGNKYTINSSGGLSLSFVLNQEFDEPLPNQGISLKTIAKKEGDKIILTSTTPDGRTGLRIYDFSEKGLILTLTNDNVSAKRYYSRA